MTKIRNILVAACMLLLTLFLTACDESSQVVSMGEVKVATSETPAPRWTIEHPYEDGNNYLFVVQSTEKISQEKAKLKAEKIAYQKISEFLGVKGVSSYVLHRTETSTQFVDEATLQSVEASMQRVHFIKTYWEKYRVADQTLSATPYRYEYYVLAAYPKSELIRLEKESLDYLTEAKRLFDEAKDISKKDSLASFQKAKNAKEYLKRIIITNVEFEGLNRINLASRIDSFLADYKGKKLKIHEAPELGYIKVITKKYLNVQIDGIPKGEVSPGEPYNFPVEPGKHSLTFIKKGYETLQENVEVLAGEKAIIRRPILEKKHIEAVKLESSEKFGHIKIITIPDETIVFIDGIEKEPKRLERSLYENIPFGRHEFVIKKHLYHDYAITYELNQSGITPLAEAPIELNPNFGTAIINSDPSGARIYVDGNPEGKTPKTIKIKSGERT